MIPHGTRWSVPLFFVAAAVLIDAAGEFRADHWRLYLTFLVLVNAVMPFVVEVLPRLALGLPELATTLGFLYIGGPPIAVLFFLNTILVPGLLAHKLRGWWDPIGDMPRFSEWREKNALAYVTEASTFATGLLVRWHVASSIAGPNLPLSDAPAIIAGEACGYTTWLVLAVIPFYPGRGDSGTLLPLSMPGDSYRSALVDMGLVSAFALTPFIFLVSYGYQETGLVGAVGAALAALAPHFIFKRLTDRRRQLEQQNQALEDLNRELEHRERLSAIGKMSTIVSHQILQHLGVIGLHADLIRNVAPEGDDQLAKVRENAAAIEQSLAGVNRVLEDLLIFSRDQRVNLHDHSVPAVLAECAQECEQAAAAKHVRIELGTDEPLVARFDKLKIKQAVVNLMRNAIHASPVGGTVQLGAGVDGTDVSIVVVDEGPGVPAAEREKIFAPFHSTREQGTGLGLAIAQVFAQCHGGDIEVDAAAEHGARFVLRLPQACAETFAAAEHAD